MRATPRTALDAAADELYGVPLDAFTAQRDARVAAARATGERALAAAIADLRKPTRSAWLVNQLVRAQPQVGAELTALGAALRAAEQTLSGPALRPLSAQRARVVAVLVAQARGLAEQPASAEVLGEVQSTLEAALADPDVATAVSEGRLVRPVARAGFGVDRVPGERGGPGGPRAVAPVAASGSTRSSARQQHEQQRRRRIDAAEAALAATRAEAGVAERAADEAEVARASLAQDLDELRERVHDVERRLAEVALEARRAARRREDAQRAIAEAERAAERARR